MAEAFRIRDSGSDDLDAIVSLYPRAFPDEDLVPLVRELLADTEHTTSIVCEEDSEVVGHIVLSECEISGSPASASLLGPLAVAPALHGQGIGSALIRAGLQRTAEDGFSLVLVLGDPAFYGRFGFEAEPRIRAPYPLPAEWSTAWQSQQVVPGERASGTLIVSAPWQHPALWTS